MRARECNGKMKSNGKQRKGEKWCLSSDTARIARENRKVETRSSRAWRIFQDWL